MQVIREGGRRGRGGGRETTFVLRVTGERHLHSFFTKVSVLVSGTIGYPLSGCVRFF